jgi:hypothetical protein
MILFVNNNSGILFIVTTITTMINDLIFEWSTAEIWREIKRLNSIITKVLNIDSPID